MITAGNGTIQNPDVISVEVGATQIKSALRALQLALALA
jgi:hypothetical protein